MGTINTRWRLDVRENRKWPRFSGLSARGARVEIKKLTESKIETNPIGYGRKASSVAGSSGARTALECRIGKFVAKGLLSIEPLKIKERHVK